MLKTLTCLFIITNSRTLGSENNISCQQQFNHEDEDFMNIKDVIDLVKYPLDRPDSTEYADLIELCQTQLKQFGSVDLPGFIRDDVLQEMAAEVDNLPSHNRLNIVSAYGAALDDEPDDEGLINPLNNGQDHPARRRFAQDVFAVAGDMIPGSALIRKVYDSPMVMRFLARAQGKEVIYHMDDEFQNINVHYMYDGCARAWHYDGTDTVITILLQKPHQVDEADILDSKKWFQGGEYEFAPFIRGAEKGEENFEAVARLFEGSYDKSIVKDAEAGTLNLFNGQRSLHRVRSVYGARKRIIAILSYDTKPHVQGAVQKNIKLYGYRVAEIYRSRGQL